MKNRYMRRPAVKKLAKLIEADGWYLYRENQGHQQYKHPTKKGKITIPHDVTKNIELSVLRQAGLRNNHETTDAK